MRTIPKPAAKHNPQFWLGSGKPALPGPLPRGAPGEREKLFPLIENMEALGHRG